ncbi:MAG: GbsR/MarR family transcriptional regulator [Streptosporangiaceae bacterium]
MNSRIPGGPGRDPRPPRSGYPSWGKWQVTMERDEDAVRDFTERLASAMVEAGIPRMPALIFAAVSAADSGRLTAAELAAVLGASPAAISGGVRYLTGLGMAIRERDPGSRRLRYRVPDNVWDEVVANQTRLLTRWATVLREGVAVLGPDTPAGARMRDSVQFFEFVAAEIPRVLDRWQELAAGRAGPDR